MMFSSLIHPIPPLGISPLELLIELLSLAGVVLITVRLVVAWPSIPDKVPLHFGFSGMPDGWGGKWAIFLLPAVAWIIYVAYSGIWLTGSHPFWPVTEANFACGLIEFLKPQIVWLVAYGFLKEIAVVQGRAQGTGRLVIWLFLLLPVATIIYVVLAQALMRH